jgi:glycosyltransferase involved in cell wall biosynthesis
MSGIIDELTIIIITYNRESLLKLTVDALLKSPFSKCKIKILNNNSTDNTKEEICRYVQINPNLEIITNKINIGGDGNILRAIEYAETTYLWILADDDTYNFKECDDVIEQIQQGKVDLIHVGGHTDVEWIYGGNISTPQEQIKKGYPYFKICSFLPANIFKVRLAYPYIIDGYKNIINMYPHMPFLIAAYQNNNKFYISKRRIVNAIIGQQKYGYGNCLSGWIDTSTFLKTKKERKLFIFNQDTESNKIQQIANFTSLCIKQKMPFKSIATVMRQYSIIEIIIINVIEIFYLPFRFIKNKIIKFK